MLAGRNAETLARQSKESGFPYQVVESNDVEGLKRILEPAVLVIHCGGPFKHTAKFMVAACLATKTHYTDITGEHQVFELLAGMDTLGKDAGIMIMPGTGFDVVPSDCLAAHLKIRLPSATHLQLAFTSSKPATSRGSKKTSVEGLGEGGLIRKGGVLTKVDLGNKVMNIDFGAFRMNALCIPWGDISTAWRSTGIPNVEVFMGATESMIRNARLSNYVRWLFRLPWVSTYLLNKINERSAGPSEERRDNDTSFFWGKVWNDIGEERVSRLVTVNGYTLTAQTAVLVAEKILRNTFKIGYQTPSMAYGPDFILEIANTHRTYL